jgi:hypothetical protein
MFQHLVLFSLEVIVLMNFVLNGSADYFLIPLASVKSNVPDFLELMAKNKLTFISHVSDLFDCALLGLAGRALHFLNASTVIPLLKYGLQTCKIRRFNCHYGSENSLVIMARLQTRQARNRG